MNGRGASKGRIRMHCSQDQIAAGWPTSTPPDRRWVDAAQGIWHPSARRCFAAKVAKWLGRIAAAALGILCLRQMATLAEDVWRYYASQTIWLRLEAALPAYALALLGCWRVLRGTAGAAAPLALAMLFAATACVLIAPPLVPTLLPELGWFGWPLWIGTVALPSVTLVCVIVSVGLSGSEPWPLQFRLRTLLIAVATSACVVHSRVEQQRTSAIAEETYASYGGLLTDLLREPRAGALLRRAQLNREYPFTGRWIDASFALGLDYEVHGDQDRAAEIYLEILRVSFHDYRPPSGFVFEHHECCMALAKHAEQAGELKSAMNYLRRAKHLPFTSCGTAWASEQWAIDTKLEELQTRLATVP